MPTALLDDAVASGKPKPRPTASRREKRLEDLRQRSGGDAIAVVGYGDDHVRPRAEIRVPLGFRQREHDVAGLQCNPTAAGQAVARVRDQVQHHLLQLAGVHAHPAHAIQADRQADPLT